MPTRLKVPASYRPWPSENALNREAADGDWRTLPDEYNPYLGIEGLDPDHPQKDRNQYVRAWTRFCGVDPRKLPAVTGELEQPAVTENRSDSQERTLVGADEPGSHLLTSGLADWGPDTPSSGTPTTAGVPLRSADDEDTAPVTDAGGDETAGADAGDVGDDELIFADIEHDEDGMLFYRFVSTEPDGSHTALNSRGDHITDDEGRDIITDADGYPVAKNREGDLLGIDAEGKVYYLHKIPHKGKDVACNRDGNILHLHGKPIEVDEDNYPVPVEPSLLQKIVHGARKTDEVTEEEVLYNKDGRPVRPFAVPAPGKAIHGITGDGPLKSRHRVLAGLAAALLAIGGISYAVGMNKGSSRVPAAGMISDQEAQRYGLTANYDKTGAESFGKTYLTICLTNTGEAQQSARSEYLKSVQSSSVNSDCGITLPKDSGDGSQPMSVNANGQFEPQPAASHGNGGIAKIGYEVAMADGSFTSYTVPIWAGDANGVPSYRVVGNLGEMPASKSAPVDNTDTGEVADPKLANELQGTLTAFFKAWGSSTQDQLAAATTKDATGAAKEGMNGAVRKPTVTGAKVIPQRLPDEQDGNSAVWNYRPGDVAYAHVNVEWEKPTTAEPMTAANGYLVTLVFNGSKWEVQDLSAGTITPGEGGSSSGQTSTDTLGSVDDMTTGK